jgi:hypothetical protein
MRTTKGNSNWPNRFAMRTTDEDRANAEAIARDLITRGRIFVSISDVIREALAVAAEKAAPKGEGNR